VAVETATGGMKHIALC